MSFKLQNFWRFCDHIQVNTKELGTINLRRRFGTQRWVMHEIARGLEEGVHDFTNLKCRQIGLSTIFLALDLYWVFKHPGINGSIVTHNEGAHNDFRMQLGEYYRSLPKSMKLKQIQHNRNQFAFRDMHSGRVSRLQYAVAGEKKKGGGGLGRSKGTAYLHATEMSSWGDGEGMQSLRASLAETNPDRLYIYESTARGFNEFEEAWRIARRSLVSQRAIFVSWWAHELYRVASDSPEFKAYWGVAGKMTREERALTRDVALLYGDAMQYVNGTKEISPEQWAWYRWYSEEKVSDADLVKQEMPTTEHQAFIVTGSQFYSGRSLAENYKRIRMEPNPEYFRIEIRHHMTDTEILRVPKKVANLAIWQTPQVGAHYVLGADPAFGSSDWADRFVVSVWRAYADRLTQVAEFASADFMPYSFAWVMCYLAGCYAPCHWNLEVNGPGQAVLGEIDTLKKMQWSGSPHDRGVVRNFVGGMREFLYRRIDTYSAAGQARGTMSTLKEKERYMATFHDYFERGMLEPHSLELIDEMKSVVREAGSAPAASGRNKDDRVIAGALATQMWHDKMRPDLMRKGVTFQRTEKEPGRQLNVYEAMIARRQALLGIRPSTTIARVK